MSIDDVIVIIVTVAAFLRYVLWVYEGIKTPRPADTYPPRQSVTYENGEQVITWIDPEDK